MQLIDIIKKLPFNFRYKLYRIGQFLITINYVKSDKLYYERELVVHDLQSQIQSQKEQIDKLKLEVDFARSQFVQLAKRIHDRK